MKTEVSVLGFRVPPLFFRAGATTGARTAAVAMLLAVMAIGARKFSPEEFGLWVVLYALMNFALIGDFGFRYALGNRLAVLKRGAHPSFRHGA
jgi:O-antigen/teichoic acid export membrane protein